MADKINFGKRTIEALKLPDAGRVRYHDSGSRFLYLDVFPSGKKTFQYVRWTAGKTQFLKIGNFPEMTPTEARAKADDLSGDISKGKPLAASGKARETFSDLFASYLENHLKTQTRSWRLDLRWFEKCLVPLHKMPLKHITPQTVRDFHKKMAKEHGEVSANRLGSLISRTYNYAIKEKGAFLANPAIGLTKFEERSRARHLDDIEIKRFFQALDTMDIEWQDFFKLALFTGARRANIQAAKWADIDIERKIWTISEEEFKTGDATDIILSDTACEILKRRLEKSESEHVFPSHGKNGHIVETKSVWRRLLEKSGIKNFHMHDLRRTFGSYQANAGASLQVIGKSLGHRSTDATEIYARLDLAPVRESVEKATAAIMEAVNKKDKKE
jgi:integrase